MVSTIEWTYLAFALAAVASIFSWKVSAWIERERWIRALDSRQKWMHCGKISFADFPFAIIDLIRDVQLQPWNKALLDGEDCFLPTHRFGRFRKLPERGSDAAT